MSISWVCAIKSHAHTHIKRYIDGCGCRVKIRPKKRKQTKNKNTDENGEKEGGGEEEEEEELKLRDDVSEWFTLTLSAPFPSEFDAFVIDDDAVSFDVEFVGWKDDVDDSVMADSVDVEDDVDDTISSAMALRADVVVTAPISFPIWICIWCGPFPFEIVLYLFW